MGINWFIDQEGVVVPQHVAQMSTEPSNHDNIVCV